MKVYPIFLNNLAGRRCVVFGSGHEAERKVEGLLECDVDVEVIHPTLTGALAARAAEGHLTWTARTYRPGDLKGALLAIVAEPDPATIAAIWQEAQDENVLLNAMDDVPHCSFVAGSVVRRGPLVVSISTSGCAPALAVRIRQQFEALFGPEYATFLEWMQALREPMAATYPDFQERRKRWYQIVDAGILDLLKEGRHEEAHDRLVALTGLPAALT